MRIGLIGGSGLYEIEGLEITNEVSISTPYGNPSSVYKIGTIDDKEIVFLPRHGTPHTIPPHKINYRANIWGFKSLDVDRIISVSAVGGINKDFFPGHIVLLDQIIDMTYGARESTFYDKESVIHIDFTDPYCPEMRDFIIKASHNIKLPVKPSGTYICVNGPRLETAKEIQFFSMIGADVVGMTAMPEASLARELEMCICGISVVTNYAAGISDKKLTATEVVETMKNSINNIKSLVKEVIKHITIERNCPCKDALKDARC
ncbi:putative S-methyl-5'-thioinosine phosphorylase [Dissulfurispira thermophila]|uniref:S-methyl-5'-thioadenosine phosphorylase n=2 Tax=root TaxID=1 RepID=A0A5J4L2R2_9ZZZZ|nr:S-methyl-5'-thioadenosine phosphorylase [Dissulfurispira thermophila]BCB95816.1 putative S-methyl-5'-thioinosine phosphorylase [Dissulfurispira thermophila]